MREQVQRPASSLTRVMVEPLSLWSEISWDFTWNTIRCTACLRMSLHTNESLPPTLKNQIKAQNKKNNVNRAKKSMWADLLDCWLNLYRSLYHHRVHVWSCKLNNFFNIAEHRIHMDETSKKLLYVDKWRKKQRWWKRKSNQDKLIKQKKK